MKYDLFLSREAVKTLDRLDHLTERRISRRLDRLQTDPGRQGKQLKGLEGLRVIRVGDWRLLYTVEENPASIYIVAIKPRGQAHRNL